MTFRRLFSKDFSFKQLFKNQFRILFTFSVWELIFLKMILKVLFRIVGSFYQTFGNMFIFSHFNESQAFLTKLMEPYILAAYHFPTFDQKQSFAEIYNHNFPKPYHPYLQEYKSFNNFVEAWLWNYTFKRINHLKTIEMAFNLNIPY